MGLEAYLTQLRARMAALDTLLTHYNDGRRKTLFATAAYLLDWPALQAVMEQLAAHPEWLDLPAKPRRRPAAGGRGPPGHLPPAEEEAQETFVIGFPGSPIPPPS